MSRLKAAVEEWSAHADPKAGLKEWTKQLCRILSEHEDALNHITYSYRLCPTETGYVCAFSLVEGRYIPKTEMDEADVIVSGRERDLMDILQRKVSPLSALLRGKIQIKGSKAALIAFGEFL